VEQRKPTGLSAILSTTDGLSMSAQMFSRLAGRELSPGALEVLVFLSQNGSPDLADDIIRLKEFQTSVGDLTKFTEVLSPAMAHLQIIEAQAKANQSRV